VRCNSPLESVLDVETESTSRIWWIKLHENLIPKSTVFLMVSLLSSLQPAESSSHMCALVPNTNSPVIHSTALSRLKRLDAGVTPRRTGFYPSPHDEEFILDKVALRQGFSPSISVALCQNHPTNAPYPFIYHRYYVKLATDSVWALDPLSRWPVFRVHWPPFILTAVSGHRGLRVSSVYTSDSQNYSWLFMLANNI
jgi:hypothetical protein